MSLASSILSWVKHQRSELNILAGDRDELCLPLDTYENQLNELEAIVSDHCPEPVDPNQLLIPFEGDDYAV